MEFNDVISKRRMVRAYTGEPVDPQVAHRILAAANRAPSAGFSQGYALLVLDQPDQLRPFWELMTSRDDEAAAAAVDEGLGALFFGIMPWTIASFRELYGVPEQYVPIGAVAIGHPDQDTAADRVGSARVIKRRDLADLVHRGRW